MVNPSKLSRSAIGPMIGGPGKVTGRLVRVFGGSTTVQAAGRFLRKNLWAWPVIAAVLLGGVGWWVNREVESALRQQREIELTTLLDAEVAALRAWIADQKSSVKVIALNEKVDDLTEQLLKISADSRPDERVRNLVLSKAQAGLRAQLAPRLKQSGHVGFFVVAPSGVVLAADIDAPVGRVLEGYRREFFDKAADGQTVLSKPYRSTLLLQDKNGEEKTNLPTMFVATPMAGPGGKTAAVLGLRIRPEDAFTKILQIVRYGDSGETYAFDRDGLLLSQSRFDKQMKELGLLADQPDVQSILTMKLRDPGVDTTTGKRSSTPRDEQPLTELVAAAVKAVGKGGKNNNVDGYRDYRGVPTIGAWEWLDDVDFGVATEIDVAEAFKPLYVLRFAFRILMVMLLVAAIGIFVAMVFIARQQRDLQKAALTARQLGQYALEEKLGEGGMGAVYKARHAMLRRPTAVKLLDVDKLSESAAKRFEREVQLTSALTHPNTVAIFDYGRTPEGVFYYAMEYLEGMNLDDLIVRYGPLSAGRAIYILRQVCGSLAEAHARSLIHRDIKPANIFLTSRGGQWDFVKVLDFGLVKTLDAKDTANLTAANAITGTPLYLSPEAVQHPDKVDPRSDVYGIGAVAYYLVCGRPPFDGETVMEICLKHVRVDADPPSKLGCRIPEDLEALIMRCLAKNRDDRPADAAVLEEALAGCQDAGSWTARDAAKWWEDHAKVHTVAGNSGQSPTKEMPPALNATVGMETRDAK